MKQVDQLVLQQALDRKFVACADPAIDVAGGAGPEHRTIPVDPGSGKSNKVVDLGVMADGHAGLTYGFGVVGGDGDRRDYVIKLAPPGVRRSGNTDVYRLVPLTRTLRAAGRPVPDIPFASDDDEELGTAYIIMERLPGRTFIIWEPDAGFGAEDAGPVWRQAVAELANIHAVDWRPTLGDWQAPRSLADLIEFWLPLVGKAQDPVWREKGAMLAEKLRRRGPAADGPVGIFHGDFQPGNILYDQGRMTGVIDWELSGIGPQGLDLGWLLMMMDAPCWHADWMPVCPLGRDEIIDLYAAARTSTTGGAGAGPLPDPDWYQALACFVFGTITGLNVYLHHTGKRCDPIWEKFELCGESLLDRGLALVR